MFETTTPHSRLSIKEKDLLLDGAPIRLLSGAMHYFRTLPPQWDDRLAKLKAMGLNCIETYVAWNIHQPTPDRFIYEGLGDLPAFIEAVARHGMKVIVRPGPYICAEWEFGGLPAWLLADDDVHLRASEPRYLAAVDRFFADLIPRLLPYAAEEGGPLIAMQVENEYGSYGRDRAYLEHLAQRIRALGYEGLLFTSDGPTETMLSNGTLPGIWKTVNFGSRAEESFAELDRHETGPRMVMEFWNGWFDHWGEDHHVRPAGDAAKSLDEILSLGGHVNLYMAHGGTNFGFWSGANADEEGHFQPTITSYDYDCPLTEAGWTTDKYRAFQHVFAKHGAVISAPPADGALLPPTRSRRVGSVALLANVERLVQPIATSRALPMEKLGHNTGYALYRTMVKGLKDGFTRPLRVKVRDRAHIFLDGRLIGILARDDGDELQLTIPIGEHQLEILVENQGRINYGRELCDRKGLIGGVWLDYTELTDWRTFPLPLGELPDLCFEGSTIDSPGFHQFEFEVAHPLDGYLDLPGWIKGVAYLNGFNLGRYWEIGPQRRMYLPYPLMRVGTNLVTLFETDGAGEAPTIVSEQAWAAEGKSV